MIRELVCFSEMYETDVELAKHETNAEQIEKLRIYSQHLFTSLETFFN
jgi:hypothetical protein